MPLYGSGLAESADRRGLACRQEWIDSGSLVERVDFVADEIGNIDRPGVRNLVDELLAGGALIIPGKLLNYCLESLGFVEQNEETRVHIINSVAKSGEIRTDNPEDAMFVEQVLLRTLKMIIATR